MKKTVFCFTMMSLMAVLLLFQNCAETTVEFNAIPDCVEGKTLSVYADPSKTGQVVEDFKLGQVTTYTGAESALENGDYYSYSMHPINGPIPLGFELHVFFYQPEGSEGLYLNFYANVDDGGSGENRMEIEILTSGNKKKDQIILIDDVIQDEFILDDLGSKNIYKAKFLYGYNTDGGIIGPFKESNFKIQVNLFDTGDIQTARFYSANKTSFALANEGAITSFIITQGEYSTCEP